MEKENVCSKCHRHKPTAAASTCKHCKSIYLRRLKAAKRIRPLYIMEDDGFELCISIGRWSYTVFSCQSWQGAFQFGLKVKNKFIEQLTEERRSHIPAPTDLSHEAMSD